MTKRYLKKPDDNGIGFFLAMLFVMTLATIAFFLSVIGEK